MNLSHKKIKISNAFTDYISSNEENARSIEKNKKMKTNAIKNLKGKIEEYKIKIKLKNKKEKKSNLNFTKTNLKNCMNNIKFLKNYLINKKLRNKKKLKNKKEIIFKKVGFLNKLEIKERKNMKKMNRRLSSDKIFLNSFRSIYKCN